MMSRWRRLSFAAAAVLLAFGSNATAAEYQFDAFFADHNGMPLTGGIPFFTGALEIGPEGSLGSLDGILSGFATTPSVMYTGDLNDTAHIYASAAPPGGYGTPFFASFYNGDITDADGAIVLFIQDSVGPSGIKITSYVAPFTNLADTYAAASYTLTPVSSAPEPGAWSLMFGGVGLAGMALRRRKEQAGAPFAA